MYIRVCVDDDVDAARQALGAQVLGYAMARPGTPKNAGYRAVRADGVRRRTDRTGGAARARGGPVRAGGGGPDEMLRAVGYYGPAAGAPAAFARLCTGLDETIVRVITARRGLEPVAEAMAALTPSLIRAAARP
jgi:hypothetical protein